MNQIFDTWDKDDFKAFLMIHLAHADLEVSQDELILIMKNVSTEKYRKVKKVWDNSNDYECLQMIKKLRERYFPGKEGKEELINGMIEFANADERFSTNEKILIGAMNKLL